MNLPRLVLRRIAGSPFRSGLIFLCLALVASATVLATLVLRAAEQILYLSVTNMDQPGVDLVVLPRVDGYSRTGLGNVDLPGLLNEMRSTPGVERASPQLLLARLTGSAYCTRSEMFVIALDPETDFSVLAWSEADTQGELAAGEAFGGSLVSVPGGSNWLDLAGFQLKLAGQLGPTGTSLDQSLFINFDTYQQMADQEQLSPNGSTLDFQAAPYILIKIAAGSDRDQVGGRLLKNIRGISVFDKDAFFNMARGRMIWMLRNIPALLSAVWLLASLWIALIFFIALYERGREIAVLRALGWTQRSVLLSLMLEGSLLALTGGLAGIVLSLLAYGLARSSGPWSTLLAQADWSLPALLLPAMQSLGMALASVIAAALFPAWWINRRDPAEIMRG